MRRSLSWVTQGLLAMEGKAGGKPLPSRCLAASLWVKSEGKWRELHYQETPVDCL
jgi:hypothetical protein